MTPPTTRPFLLALALDGLGAPNGPTGIADLGAAVSAAEAAGVALLTLGDPLAPEDAAGDTMGAGLSATEVLAWVARKTTTVGVLSTATTHYTEPFFAAKAIATLDYISQGRAGLLIDPTANDLGDARFPALPPLDAAGLLEQGAEFVEVVRQLWDSWEDGATVREVATGRYVDNTKIHHINHTGAHFTVKGPLITPRPPQGQPPVAVRLGAAPGAAAEITDGVITDGDITLAAAIADIVFLAVPTDGAGPGADGIAGTVAHLGAAAARVGRGRADLTVIASAAVGQGDATAVVARLADHPDLDGVELRADPSEVSALIAALAAAPGPAAASSGAGAATLRERLGLSRPASRYASAP